MSTPCTQEQNIEHILHAIERMETNQDRLVNLLEKVANQDARIVHVEDHAENTYKDLNEVFGRLRECELNLAANGHDRINSTLEELTSKIETMNTRLEKVSIKYNMFTCKYAIYFYVGLVGAVFLGFLSDLWNHFEWIKEIWRFWKGD